VFVIPPISAKKALTVTVVTVKGESSPWHDAPMTTIHTAHCKTETSHLTPSKGLGMALAAESGAPAWVQLLPKGREITGRDGRKWMISDPQAVVAASLARRPLHIDYEHASEHRAPLGLEAPAAGWISTLEVREDGIWAQVEWTPRAEKMIADREYRFISPTFIYDGKTDEIVEFISAGLTNQPNLDLTALNRSENRTEHQTEILMNLKALCKALGLHEDASPEAVLTSVNALVQRADNPPLEKFAPRSDYDAAVKKAADAETALNQIKDSMRETEITELVEGAIKDGKITPAAKDFYLTSCRFEGGLEAFKGFLKSAPVHSVKADSGLDDKIDPGSANGALSEQEKAVCRNLGLSEEDFLKAKRTAH
jgi:phage I-like protein